MAVAACLLTVCVEALRHYQVERILRTRHGDVQQPSLFLDLVALADRQVARNAAVDDVEHEHLRPFLSLGRMDGGEDEIVLIQVRRPGQVAGGVRRIKRQLGEELLPRGVAGRDLFQLKEVGATNLGVFVESL